MPGNDPAMMTVSRNPVAMHIMSPHQPAVNAVRRNEDFSAGMGVCADGGKECHKCEAESKKQLFHFQ